MARGRRRSALFATLLVLFAATGLTAQRRPVEPQRIAIPWPGFDLLPMDDE